MRIWITLVAALSVAFPAAAGAQITQRGNTKETVAQARALALRGRSVVTPIEIAFESTGDFDRFASGAVPLDLVLRSTASGQTIRIPSRDLLEGFRPGRDRRAITVHLLLGDLIAPLWDDRGCIDTRAEGRDGSESSPAVLTLTYAPCAGAPAAARPGNPIPIIVVKGGKNPSPTFRIGIGPSTAGTETEQSLRARFADSRGANVIVYKGSGPPRHQGF
jgi:hypothetical protein